MDWATPQGRLKWARDRAGLSRAEVSVRTGISAKMVEAHENGRRMALGLSSKYSGHYARAYGVSESWLLTGSGDPVGARGGIIRVPVRGRLQAGVWAPGFDLSASEQFEVPIAARPDLARETLYGAVVRGTSMNRVYPEGTVVILRRAIDLPRDLVNGRRYHVERVRADGLVENTLKQVKISAEGRIWLVPQSDDPEFSAAIPLETDGKSDIGFVGRVVMAIIEE